jgi:putative transposase
VSELAADGIPVAVTCRVLNLARQPYYRWLTAPVIEAELVEAYRDDPEFGYRFLADEAAVSGEPMAGRTAWRICSANRWWSAFGKRRRGKNGRPGAPTDRGNLPPQNEIETLRKENELLRAEVAYLGKLRALRSQERR